MARNNIYNPPNAGEEPAVTNNPFARVKTFLLVACCIALVGMETVILAYTAQTSKIDQETNATVNRVRTAVDNILLRALAFPVTSREARSFDAIEVDDVSPFNGTCKHMRMFRIPESDKRITVCTYQGQVRVDMRVWLGEKATIKGIYFSPNEYFTLSSLNDMLTDEIHVQQRIASIKQQEPWQPEPLNFTQD